MRITVLPRRPILILAMLSIALVVLAFVGSKADAKQTHLFKGSFGSVAQPTFQWANGLAVDKATGDLLVIDTEAKTVLRFKADGTPDNFPALGTNVIDAKGGGKCATVPADCDQTPQNGFSFTPIAGEQQVAIDNSGTATDGNIYVTQGQQAAGNLVDIFAADGEYLGQLTAAGATKFGTVGFPLSPCGVAVDDTGNVYLGGGYDSKIYKFDPAANPPVNADIAATFPTTEPVCNLAAGSGPSGGSIFADTFFTFEENSVLKLDDTTGVLRYVVDPGEARLVSVDPVSGHLFSFSGRLVNGNLAETTLKEYDASGASPTLLSETSVSGATGLAVNGASLYLSTPSSGTLQPLKTYGPLVTIPDVTTDGATITGDTSVTVNGTVNPDGVALEECSFEYGLTATYGTSVPCAETVAEIGTTVKDVHADLSGLDPESQYHYHLVAKNANATVPGLDRTFKTPGKPAIPSLGSLNVSDTEATLIAKINPENSPTTYHFEWGPDTSYANSTPELAVGSDEAEHAVSQSLGELTPGITYHYRAVASNGLGVTESTDHTFTTFPAVFPAKVDCANAPFRVALSAPLPDCRAYEMVSPIDKNGGDIKVLVNLTDFPTRLDQSAADGESMTYSAVPAFSDPESAPFVSQYLARRTGGGWSSAAINPPRESVPLTDNPLRLDVQYKLFSPDLGNGWLFQDADPPLDPCAPAGFINLYRRDNSSGSYEALLPNAPTNVTPSTDYRLEVQGVSADGTRAVFRANAKLTSDAANSGTNAYQLYEHVKGEGCGVLRLVSLLPNGKPSTQVSSRSASVGAPAGPAEYSESTVARAVSADGSRIYFNLGEGPTAVEGLFLRVNADQPQSTVSAGKCTEPAKGCTLSIAAANARFWTAATDGSVGVYSVGEELLEYDAAKALAGEAASKPITTQSKGVVGASEDASRIYFVSSEEIDGEGVAGQPNIYLYQREQSGSERYRLVATLDPRDLVGFRHSGFSLANPRPITNGVRVSPDGSHLAFVSTKSLSGYDNTDAVDGLPDLEVYRYELASGKVSCVSCNPSGAQPRGREFGPENNVIRRVSAQMAPGENQSFAPRSLSADGSRLFFESFESLLPRDVNKTMDVYEWQGAGDAKACEAAGAELYVQKSGGCLSLISSGQDEVDSEFADASPDGSDVFIRTASSLLPQDPGQVDVYDVREGGGFPLAPTPGVPCETAGNPAACQAASSAPSNPPLASQGPSSGNVAPKACPKGKVLRKGKCAKKPHKPKKSKGKSKGGKRAANKSKGAGR
jgi:hypothetical protein